MTKAVVEIGGHQYLVAEKDVVQIDLLPESTKNLEFDVFLLIDGKNIKIGNPTVKGVKVIAEVIDSVVKGKKIRVIRYKAKKRVHKEMGHRQKYSLIKIVSIK